VGVTTQQDDIRGGARAYHSWVQDYITFDLLSNSAYAMVNTPHATLQGCEAFGECDLLPRLSAFGTLNFVEGRDESRDSSISRQRLLIDPDATPDERSEPIDPITGEPIGGPAGNAHENLPVIAPLWSRLGLRLHNVAEDSPWTIEFAANVSDAQEHVATSLREQTTSGYATYDILCYRRMTQYLTLSGGVRNFTDKNYQTYFDTRQAGNAPVVQLFEPGINFFFGAEYTR
jgi:outer membrane cobalamin receptor